MDIQILPVDVIALWRAEGEIMPLRIRYQALDEECHGRVVEIFKIRRVGHLGSQADIFDCWVKFRQEKRICQLKYHYTSGTWNLIQPVVRNMFSGKP